MPRNRLWDVPMFYDVDRALTPGVEDCMDNQLQVALNLWIAKETQTTKDACDVLRKTVDNYEKTLLEDARIRARHRALAALDAAGEAPVSLPLMQAKEALLDALEALQDVLAPEPVETSVTPASEPQKPWHDGELLDKARDFLQGIDKTDFDAIHNTRLVHVLQVQVAECRWLLEQIPVSHTMHQVLVQALRRLGGVRGAMNCDAFIKGLARHHHDNWVHVASKAREALARYDADADAGVDPQPVSRKPKNGKAPDRDSSPAEPVELPKLLKAQEMGRIVVLFGGVRIAEKVKTIKDRTGLSVDWSEAEEGSPRNANIGVGRIRKEAISCVVILEGLISHGVWRAVADACTAEGIPYVMGGRGGIGSVIQVLETVEAKL